MERQRVKEGPPGRGIMCLFTLPLQHQPPEHKWTFTFLNDEPDLAEHEVQEPENTHKKKVCLILFNTRSVKIHFTMLVSVSQDTICWTLDLFKTHFTMLVPVSHPISTSPVIEHAAPASAVTYTELSPARPPAIEFVVPAPVVTNAAPSSVIEYVASASVVFHAAPATLIDRNALYTSGQEHEQHVWKWRKKVHWCDALFFLFVLYFKSIWIFPEIFCLCDCQLNCFQELFLQSFWPPWYSEFYGYSRRLLKAHLLEKYHPPFSSTIQGTWHLADLDLHGTGERNETRATEFVDTCSMLPERSWGLIIFVELKTYSHNGMMDYPRFPISEMHLRKFPDSVEFQSHKVNFKNEVNSKTADPQLTVHRTIWDNKVNWRIFDIAIDCGRTDLPDNDVLHAMVASALQKLLNTQIHFQKWASVEEQRVQKHDRL